MTDHLDILGLRRPSVPNVPDVIGDTRAKNQRVTLGPVVSPWRTLLLFSSRPESKRTAKAAAYPGRARRRRRRHGR